MDVVALRVLFAVGLIALGALAALAGIGLARLIERAHGSSVAHPGARSFWFKKSAAHRL